jgi:hypothetical protein
MNHHLPRAFPSPTARFRYAWHHLHGQDLASALDFEWNDSTLTAHHIPDHAVVHSKKARNPMAIDLQNLVSSLQTSHGRGRILFHVTDHRGQVRFAHGMADGPNDTGEKQGQE